MVKKVATPKQAGGGGFVFADKVLAWLLAHSLNNEFLFNTETGWLERVDFEARVDGWLLDDLVLTLKTETRTHRCALSVKSNRQFSANGAPSDFVRTAWELYLGTGQKVFDQSLDYLGIVTSPLDLDIREALDFVVTNAADGDSRLLPNRYMQPGWANELKRKMFHSFSCPEDIAKSHNIQDEDIGRLLSRMKHLHLDFESTVSEDEKHSIERCRRALTSGDQVEAQNLWDALKEVSAGKRRLAGACTRVSVLESLRGRFNFAELPEHRKDWDRLADLTNSLLKTVGTAIGGNIFLNRSESMVKLEKSVQNSVGVALLGASGVGKSSAARTYIEQLIANGETCLWFDSSSFARPDFAELEAALRLQHPLPELLDSVADARPVLVLDGLDRVFDPTSISIAAQLIGIAVEARTPWHVIVTAQSQEWPRLKSELSCAGVDRTSWQDVELDSLQIHELGPVWKAIPKASSLQYNKALHPLLRNLKVLDLIAQSLRDGESIDTSRWIGETDVAQWYWETIVQSRPERHRRALFAMRLAENQAKTLRPEVPLNEFDDGELKVLPDLEKDGVCRTLDGRLIGFVHELLGDWSRLQALLTKASLDDSIAEAVESPVWHRAIRLVGIYLLENKRDIERWRDTIKALEGNRVAQDLFLEAPVFASDPSRLLNIVKPELSANDGLLLRRMLRRFLLFGTVPNPILTAIAQDFGMDEASAAAEYRKPYWPYWGSVLDFLDRNRSQLVPLAPRELSRIAGLWLKHTSSGTPFRDAAARVGLEVAKFVFDQARTFGNGGKTDQQYYEVALLGVAEEPVEVSEFLRLACRRINPPKREGPLKSTEPDHGDLPRGLSQSIFYDPDAPAPEPFVNGPLARVGSCIRKAVLESGSILPVVRTNPALARELILACLIRAPLRMQRSDLSSWEEDLGLESHVRWHPAFYTDGPFLMFLRNDFAEGLNLILTLVHFATKRWVERAQSRAERYQNTKNQSFLRSSVEDVSISPNKLELSVGCEIHSLAGDFHVYGWSSGHGNPPSCIKAALMALEKYFYIEIETSSDIDDKLAKILSASRSVALLGVLVEIGKRAPECFSGALLPLLSVSQLYRWDLQAVVSGRRHFLVGGSLKGDWYAEMATKFHDHDCRKVLLRDLATRAYLTDRKIQNFMNNARSDWEDQAAVLEDGQEQDHLLRLIELFDLSNYRSVEDEEVGRYVINIKIHERQESDRSRRQELEDDLFMSCLPSKCRDLLDSGIGFSDEDLVAIPKRFRKMVSDKTGSLWFKDLDSRAVHAAAGIAAVLLRHHDKWLENNLLEREWCAGVIKSAVTGVPILDHLEVHDALAGWTWQCFAAEVIPILWSKNVGESEMRQIVARLVFSRHYQTVEILFRQCSLIRDKLGDSFSQLRRLSFEYAYIRNWTIVIDQLFHRGEHISKSVQNQLKQECGSWLKQTVLKFANCTLSAPSRDWSEMNQVHRFEAIAGLKPSWFKSQPLDFEVVRAAHNWLPRLDEANDQQEREDWLGFYEYAFSYVLSQSEKSKNHPNENESWLLGQVASQVLQMTNEEDATQFWGPVLRLSDENHAWPEYFLRAFYRAGLQSDSDINRFGEIRREMLETALEWKDDGPRWHRNVWCIVLGIDSFSSKLWQEHHAVLVRSTIELTEKWVRRCGCHGRHLGAFVAWLPKDAARSLRPTALIWIQEVLASKSGPIYDETKFHQPLAQFLRFMWEREQPRLRRDPGAFAAFRILLHRLTDAQHPLAMDLAAEVGRLA